MDVTRLRQRGFPRLPFADFLLIVAGFIRRGQFNGDGGPRSHRIGTEQGSKRQ